MLSGSSASQSASMNLFAFLPSCLASHEIAKTDQLRLAQACDSVPASQISAVPAFGSCA